MAPLKKVANLTSRKAQDDSDSESTSSSGEEAPSFDLFGGMRAALAWQPALKQLNIRLRQSAESTSVELDCLGQLNSVTGEHRTLGHVRKNFYTHTPTLQRILVAKAQRQQGSKPDEPKLDPDSWVPCGLGTLVFKDWLVAPGLIYDSAASSPNPTSVHLGGLAAAVSGASGTNPLKYALTVRKNPQVLKQGPRSDLWVTAKALVTIDPKSAEVSAVAGLRMKLMKINLTTNQDVTASVGVDIHRRSNGAISKDPYVKIGDNNVSARLQRGRWTLMYQL